MRDWRSIVLVFTNTVVTVWSSCASGDPPPANSLLAADSARVGRVMQMMERLPEPEHVGADLQWHMDRAVQYALNVLDRRSEGRPLYANYVWDRPAHLVHSEWDVPHCTGRLLHAIGLWETSTGKRLDDQQAIRLLRELLHKSISPEDHLAHFPKYCRESEEVDWHSQREVLLGLVCLANRDNDVRSLQSAKELVAAHLEIVQSPDFSPNPQTHGRMLDAVMDYNRSTDDPAGELLAQTLADRFADWCDAQEKFPAPAHNHSVLGTIANVIELGIETGQPRYIESGQRMIDGPVWSVRSSFGHVAEGSTIRGEANCTGDVVRALLMLGRNVDTKYLDEAEIIIRNYLLASQHLDASLEIVSEGSDRPADDEQRVFSDAANRCVGGFAFTLPNDLIESGYPHLAVDLVEGGMHALADAYDSLVSMDDDGIHVHLLFSCNRPELEVRSYLPAEGRIEVRARKPGPIHVRIPNSVDRHSLQLQIHGQGVAPEFSGSYLRIPRQDKIAKSTIRFRLSTRITREKVGDTQYQLEWSGDTLRSMIPLGKNVPLYTPSRLIQYGASLPDD